MSLTLQVGLLSGKTAHILANPDEAVEVLKLRAQVSLEVGKGRLLDSSGRCLDACATVRSAKIETGDCLTLHICRVQVQSNPDAFAALLGDGSVVTWGHAEHGGNSSAVQHQLKNVQGIQATGKAFAAMLGEGSVVTWGHAKYGGDSSAVQDLLKDVQHMQAGYRAIAAILGDGSVATWVMLALVATVTLNSKP